MLNYNKILKNLSPENFQKKKEEFNIKLDDLNIKEVSDILNKLDSNLLTESDFTKTKTLMDCLKYLSKKSSVYSMAKDLIINRIEMIEKTLSEHDVQFLSEIFPKNLKESLNNLNKSEERLKKLYLEKNNYDLWKDLSHEALVDQIKRGMIDLSLLEDINKNYVKNLRVESGAYDFNQENIKRNKYFLKDLLKWFPDEKMTLEKALELIEYDREIYSYLPLEIQTSKDILIKIFNNTNYGYDAFGETFEKDVNNWKIADFENKILKTITDKSQLKEIVSALINFNEDFAESKYIKHLAKNNSKINEILSILNTNRSQKIFTVNNIPETIGYEDLYLQSKEVLKEYFIRTNNENKIVVFPFLLEHFKFEDFKYEKDLELDDMKNIMAQSCLYIIMNYKGTSNKHLKNTVSFISNTLINDNDIVLALVRLHQQLDTYNDTAKEKILHKEIESKLSVDIQLNFVKMHNENKYKIAEDMRELIQRYEKPNKSMNKKDVKRSQP